jgi:hypothetical protein
VLSQLRGLQDATRGGRTPQQAQALPVCVERVSFFGLLKPQPPRLTQAPRTAEEAVVREVTATPAPARSYAVWGLLAAVVAGGGYVAYRVLRKKKKGS